MDNKTTLFHDLDKFFHTCPVLLHLIKHDICKLISVCTLNLFGCYIRLLEIVYCKLCNCSVLFRRNSWHLSSGLYLVRYSQNTT
jgi:hypothetical protein